MSEYFTETNLSVMADLKGDNVCSAIFEEYKAVKAEINSRLSGGQFIINLSITITLAIIGGLQFWYKNTFIDSNYNSLSIYSKISGTALTYVDVLSFFFLFGAVITICFCAIYIGGDIMIGQLASYVNKWLRPKLEDYILFGIGEKISLWEWEEYKNYKQFSSGWMLSGIFINSARYITSIVPSLIFFGAYITNRFDIDFFKYWKNSFVVFMDLYFLERILLSMFFIMIFAVIVLMYNVVVIYLRISKKEYRPSDR